ncbi:uncharacterized protein LOC144120104 [Amblyomma americanum]
MKSADGGGICKDGTALYKEGYGQLSLKKKLMGSKVLPRGHVVAEEEPVMVGASPPALTTTTTSSETFLPRPKTVAKDIRSTHLSRAHSPRCSHKHRARVDVDAASGLQLGSWGLRIFLCVFALGFTLSASAVVLELSYRYARSSLRDGGPSGEHLVAHTAVVSADASAGSSGFRRTMSLRRDRLHGNRCGAVWYTYCARPRRSRFYYKRSEGLCTAATDDSAHVCAKSANRFATTSACRKTPPRGLTAAARGRCLVHAGGTT